MLVISIIRYLVFKVKVLIGASHVMNYNMCMPSLGAGVCKLLMFLVSVYALCGLVFCKFLISKPFTGFNSLYIN